jgi:hypothetical protein
LREKGENWLATKKYPHPTYMAPYLEARKKKRRDNKRSELYYNVDIKCGAGETREK